MQIGISRQVDSIVACILRGKRLFADDIWENAWANYGVISIYK